MIGANTALPVVMDTSTPTVPYTPKNISSSVTCENGRLYALSFQSSLSLSMPYLGVRRNSFFFPSTASKTATVLFTDMPRGVYQ